MWTHPLQIPLGLSLWALWFGALYGGLSLGCAAAAPPPGSGPWNWLNAALGLFSLAVVALLFWCALRCLAAARQAGAAQPEGRFVARLAAGGHLAAAAATVVIALPILRLPPCV